MSKKIHPFKHIQIVEDLCTLIGEEPEATTFDWAQEIDLDGEDWDIIIDFFKIMFPQLYQIAVRPLQQLDLLIMIAYTHTQSDHLWFVLEENRDTRLFDYYRNSFLHMSDLETILPRDYGIDLLLQY